MGKFRNECLSLEWFRNRTAPRTKRAPRTSTPARCGTRTGNDPATKRQRRPIVAIASRPAGTLPLTLVGGPPIVIDNNYYRS